MYEWTNERTKERTNEWTEFKEGQMDRRTDGLMDWWMDQDEQIKEWRNRGKKNYEKWTIERISAKFKTSDKLYLRTYVFLL